MIATVTFNPAIDQNILVQGLVKDDANRATGIHRSAGGKGASMIRWWWPLFSATVPAGAMPMPLSPKRTVTSPVTTSPAFGLMK